MPNYLFKKCSIKDRASKLKSHHVNKELLDHPKSPNKIGESPITSSNKDGQNLHMYIHSARKYNFVFIYVKVAEFTW